MGDILTSFTADAETLRSAKIFFAGIIGLQCFGCSEWSAKKVRSSCVGILGLGLGTCLIGLGFSGHSLQSLRLRAPP